MSKRNSIELGWARLQCDRCGGERLAAQDCPECGRRPAPHETQPDLERRRKIVAAFRSARTPKDPCSFPFDDLTERVHTSIRSASLALTEAAKRGRDAERLLPGFAPLDQLVADTSVPLLRPNRNYGRRVHAGLVDVAKGLDRFVDALEAPNLITAQVCERDGQAFLDAGAEAVHGNDRYRLLSEQAGRKDFIEALGENHTSDESGVDFWDLGPAIAARAGLPSTTDFGVGFQADVLDVLAEASLDRANYDRLTQVADELIGHQASVLDEDGARRDLAGDMMRMSTKTSRLVEAIDAGESELTIVGEALGLLMVLRERCLRHCVALLLSIDNPASYESQRKRKTGDLLKSAGVAFPQLQLSELNRELRHAAAHEDFEVVDGVLLLNGGEVEMPADIFIDAVLQFLETYVGVQRGLILAMARTGKTYPTAETLSLSDSLDVCQYMLTVSGLTHIQFSQDSGVLTVSAKGCYRNWSATVAGIAAVLPKEIEEVQLHSSADGIEVSAGAELGPYRSLQARDAAVDDDAQRLGHMAAVAGTRENGKCPYEEDWWVEMARDVSLSRGAEDFLVHRVRRVIAVRDRAKRAGVSLLRIECILTALREGD